MKAGASTFWPSFWLGIVLFGTKVPRVWVPPYIDRWALSRYFSELTMVTAADVLYALVAGLLGQALLLAAAKRPRLQLALWRGFVGFGALSVAFGVLSMRLYDILHMPLTFTLLSLGSDPGNMRSSVGEYLTFRFDVDLLAARLPDRGGIVRAFPAFSPSLAGPRRPSVWTGRDGRLRRHGPQYGGERLGPAHRHVEALEQSALYPDQLDAPRDAQCPAPFDANVPPDYLAEFATGGRDVRPGWRGPKT